VPSGADLLCRGVVVVHVEPHAHGAGAAGLFACVGVKRPEHAAAAVVGLHVHALDPPDVAVAPVAPLLRDHELPDNVPAGVGNEIQRLGGVRQAAAHPF
jgi:hypothetical protein